MSFTLYGVGLIVLQGRASVESPMLFSGKGHTEAEMKEKYHRYLSLGNSFVSRDSCSWVQRSL